MNLEKNESQGSLHLGTITLALRLVIGWTYFSAFWRRLILENKLDAEASGYIGEKFNHFLPNALGIKPIIEYLVFNPDKLWWAMASFTIIEGIAGLLIMLGLWTRLMSLVIIFLAAGILLGSGWLGTTCLDEWQIGVLGIAGGFTIFLSGGGRYSVDFLLFKHRNANNRFKDFKLNSLSKLSAFGAVIVLFVTLFTNQYFHGGVWGDLHNKSVKPKVEISNAQLKEGMLAFTVFRVEGADVYGSFLIGVALKDNEGNTVFNLNGNDLSNLQEKSISNVYVAKVKSGKHSLVLPLGAKARLTFNDKLLLRPGGNKYTLVLTDISGIEWKQEVIAE